MQSLISRNLIGSGGRFELYSKHFLQIQAVAASIAASQ
jgi:hypothetical protein